MEEKSEQTQQSIWLGTKALTFCVDFFRSTKTQKSKQYTKREKKKHVIKTNTPQKDTELRLKVLSFLESQREILELSSLINKSN